MPTPSSERPPKEISRAFTWSYEGRLLCTQDVNGGFVFQNNVDACDQKSCKASRRFWDETWLEMIDLKNKVSISTDARLQLFASNLLLRFVGFIAEYPKVSHQRCVRDFLRVVMSPVWWSRLRYVIDKKERSDPHLPKTVPEFYPLTCKHRKKKKTKTARCHPTDGSKR